LEAEKQIVKAREETKLVVKNEDKPFILAEPKIPRKHSTDIDAPKAAVDDAKRDEKASLKNGDVRVEKPRQSNSDVTIGGAKDKVATENVQPDRQEDEVKATKETSNQLNGKVEEATKPEAVDSDSSRVPYRRSRLVDKYKEEAAAAPEPEKRRSRFLDKDLYEDGGRRSFGDTTATSSNNKAFDRINVSSVGFGLRSYGSKKKREEENVAAAPTKSRDKKEKEEAAFVSRIVDEHLADMGVQVEARPGYVDASTQTDPVQSKAVSTSTCSFGT